MAWVHFSVFVQSWKVYLLVDWCYYAILDCTYYSMQVYTRQIVFDVKLWVWCPRSVATTDVIKECLINKPLVHGIGN